MTKTKKSKNILGKVKALSSPFRGTRKIVRNVGTNDYSVEELVNNNWVEIVPPVLVLEEALNLI